VKLEGGVDKEFGLEGDSQRVAAGGERLPSLRRTRSSGGFRLEERKKKSKAKAPEPEPGVPGSKKETADGIKRAEARPGLTSETPSLLRERLWKG